MKRIALVAAALAFAACSGKEEAPATDSVATAPAAAAPAMDSAAMNPPLADSAAMTAPAADTTKHQASVLVVCRTKGGRQKSPAFSVVDASVERTAVSDQQHYATSDVAILNT